MNKKQLGNIKLFPEIEDEIDEYIYNEIYKIYIFQCPACLNTHMCSGNTQGYYWCYGGDCWGGEDDLVFSRKKTQALKYLKQELEWDEQIQKHPLRRMYRANIDLTKEIERHWE